MVVAVCGVGGQEVDQSLTGAVVVGVACSEDHLWLRVVVAAHNRSLDEPIGHLPAVDVEGLRDRGRGREKVLILI